ncbi:MAG: septum formation protein Maf [Candidatus Eremiobacteraeota bacterium]|nr:septum formation protein Maf [Candidatus Eremiobacteraeota bacterium]
MTNPDRPRTGLCLASHSPRRRGLLEVLGVPFFVEAAGSEVEEAVDAAGRGQQAEVVALARATIKGRSVLRSLTERGENCPVLSADTVVHIEDEILDKPADAVEARRFLERLSGTEHGVVTAVWLHDGNDEHTTWRRTMVSFAALSSSTIEAYIATGEPFDKAGGYGIQGVGGTMVSRIDGCYFNVMGLPIHDLAKLLNRIGQPWTLNPQGRAF